MRGKNKENPRPTLREFGRLFVRLVICVALIIFVSAIVSAVFGIKLVPDTIETHTEVQWMTEQRPDGVSGI